MYYIIANTFQFILYFSLFSVGDYSLYFFTNTIQDFIFRTNKLTSVVHTPHFKEWVIGNSISYVFICLIQTSVIGKLYFNANEYSILYTIISPLLYFFIQDFCFFLMHRIAHIPFLYKNIHYVHHKYRYPSSWAGRISHIIDSNLENIAFTIPAIIIPMYWYSWWGCLIFTFIWGNFLHDSTNKKRIKYINDNIDHTLHHYYGERNYNFSYYFNHWDKLFGTYKSLRVKIPRD